MHAKRLSANLAVIAFALMAGTNQSKASDADPTFIHHDAFVDSHPDLYWREQGIADYKRARFGDAMTDFRRAARFADKPSQALIAQMLWNGDGVEPNRVMAYAWADLAAERGYPEFIATREKFWLELSVDERRAAVSAGQAIFDEYGDKVAKPRLENELRVALIHMTGSRTGHAGTLVIPQRIAGTGDGEPTDGSLYYADKYWKPEQYWHWQDRVWTQPPEGKVEVGPIQTPPGH